LKDMQVMGMCLSRRGKLARSTLEQREQMRAVSRLGSLLLAGALALAPVTALAQEAPPTSNAPATESVGPKDLQNFSLNGTVTREADQPAVTRPAQQRRQARIQAQPPASSNEPGPATNQAASTEPQPTPRPAPRRVQTATTAPAAAQPQRSPEQLRQSPAASSVTVALPKLDSANLAGATSATPAPTPAFAPDPAPTGSLAPDRGFPMLPWLLAALALAAGGIFLFWRNRSRHAFAGGPQVDAYVAPQPAPAPRPASRAKAPAANAPPPPSIPGIVSTRIRPWIDIGFNPLRCVLDDEKATVEFEIELFNSGSAPARAVLVEASLFNAGAQQDRDIGAFFANPVGEGERIVVIPPLKRVGLRTQVVAPRAQIQAYELGGRQVFIPLIAFNALYRWGGGEGQTSSSYMLGRDTKGEKMGPFRLDLGPRIFRGVAARQLPTAVRQ
jgi:hypothetical protein